MAINPGNRDFREWADAEAQEYKGKTSVGEAFSASFAHTIDEDLSISRFLHNEDEVARNTKLRKMVESGEISTDVELAYTSWAPGVGYKVDYSGLAEFANQELGLSLPTDEELHTNRNEMLANRRAERQDIIERSGGGGQIAAFAGGMAASMIDPVGLAAGVLTAGMGTSLAMTSQALRSLSLRQSIIAKAVIEGTVGGTLGAAAVEPFVYAWKQEIDSPYTIGDALFNIAASGLAGGTIGGFVGGIKAKFGLSNIENLDGTVEELMERGASRAEAEGLARTLYEGSRVSDVDAQEFLSQTNARADDVNNSTSQNRERTYDATNEEMMETQFQDLQTRYAEEGRTDPYSNEVSKIEDDIKTAEKIVGCLTNG
ncbi:MAG: hypothetical protein ACWGQW_05365 [bacterium]